MKLYFKAWCSKLTSLELLNMLWCDTIGDGLACWSTLIDYECKNICRIDYIVGNATNKSLNFKQINSATFE